MARHSCLRPSSATCTRRLRTPRMLKVPPWRCHSSLPPDAQVARLRVWAWALQRGASAAQAPEAARGAAPSACAKAAIRAAPHALLRLTPCCASRHPATSCTRRARSSRTACSRRAPPSGGSWTPRTPPRSSCLGSVRASLRARARLRLSTPLQLPTPPTPPPPRHPHTDPLSTPPAPFAVPRACARPVSPPAVLCIHPADEQLQGLKAERDYLERHGQLPPPGTPLYPTGAPPNVAA